MGKINTFLAHNKKLFNLGGVNSRQPQPYLGYGRLLILESVTAR